MRFRTISGMLILLALATCAAAQDKISGTVKCAKPDQFQKIDIGDKPAHAYAINHFKCMWTKPMEIGGIQTHEDVGTEFDEITSTGARGHGILIGTMSNGDKFTVSTQGKDTYKDGIPGSGSSQGTWSFTNGTGKLKGITGKGTYNGKPDSQGNMVFDVEGEYQLPK